jgi:hypothetical protein
MQKGDVQYMSKLSEADLTDPGITTMIDELQAENAKGDISCLAIVVVRHNGDASSSLCSRAPSVTLLGSFEILKGSVLNKEFNDEQSVPERLN